MMTQATSGPCNGAGRDVSRCDIDFLYVITPWCCSRFEKYINNIVVLFSELMQEVMDSGSTTCNGAGKLGVAYEVKCVALK